MNLKNQKGFTLIELLVVVAIIGILSSVAVPQYTAYKNRAYDAASKADLHNLYMACQDYWMFNSGTSACTLAEVTSNGYGFVQTTDVNITIDPNVNNTEFDFVATAQHTSSSKAFSVDNLGTINHTTTNNNNNNGGTNNGGTNSGGTNNGNGNNNNNGGTNGGGTNNGNNP